jgi:NhaA family Na+:H+ antiporter
MPPRTETGRTTHSHERPPEAWAPAHRIVRRALQPIERFLAIEASSGIVLLVAAALALVWANSPWRDAYFALWQQRIGFEIGRFGFSRDLRFWINDGLMTIFFFVVGLEIRHEFHSGVLSEPRRAALPLTAAVGGMLAPALIFFIFNFGHSSVRGWGIPMATDIAFAVGVLALLGKRVPSGLRILLLALAVIDDVGAIVVIAVFYSANLVPSGLLIAASGIAAIIVLQALGVRRPWAYVPAAIAVWSGAYVTGIHPTLAGVVVGLITPVRAWFGTERFVEHAHSSLSALLERGAESEHATFVHLDHIDRARREAVSPVDRVQHALHGWVAYGVMPLFALANAGVPLRALSFAGDSMLVFLGVAVGLAFGKPIGIVGLSWLAARFGIVQLPDRVAWKQIALVGLVGGIGFTMSLFIAELAFGPGEVLETAKLAIVVASGCAALLGYALGCVVLRRE